MLCAHSFGSRQRISTRVGIVSPQQDGEGDGDAGGEMLFGDEIESYLRENEDGPAVTYRDLIHRGHVADWPALEALLQHCFQRLQQQQQPQKKAKAEHPLLLSVPVSFALDSWELATQAAFERLQVLGFYIVQQPLMALYSHALVTGLVVDLGHDSIDITPVFDSVLLLEAVQRIPLGGSDVEQYMLKLLRSDAALEAALGRSPDVADCRRIKESGICEVMYGPGARLSRPAQDQGPAVDIDGKSVSIGSARLQCMEVLFDPALNGKSVMSLPEAMDLAILRVDLEKRIPLYENVVLCGGLSAVKGLRERLEEELTQFVAASETANDLQPKELKFVKPPEYFTKMKERPQDMAFVGAQITAQAIFKTTTERVWITRADYNELGPTAVYRKSL
ncbi:actin family [Hyaloraphidium curvatum]|nr:actin family [Hyaloraphidium curvatum]